MSKPGGVPSALLALLSLFGVLLAAPAGAQIARLYWVEYDGSGSADLMQGVDLGTGLLAHVRPIRRNVAIAPLYAAELAVDPDAGFVFWNTGDTIQRSGLGGLGGGTVVGPGADEIYDLAVDPRFGHLYWCTDAGEIHRADYDGGSPTVLPISGVGDTLSIALDPASDRIFWVSAFGDEIRRAPLAGGAAVTVVDNALPVQNEDVAVAPEEALLFWIQTTNVESFTLQQATTDGGSPATLPYPSFYVFYMNVVAHGAGSLYWGSGSGPGDQGLIARGDTPLYGVSGKAVSGLAIAPLDAPPTVPAVPWVGLGMAALAMGAAAARYSM